MKLLFFCPFWGCEDLEFFAFAEKVKAAGYDGVEASLPMDREEKDRILQVLENVGLSLIAQHWETRDSDFSDHRAGYEKRLRNLADAKPLFINSQTGKDYYSFEQNSELIELAKNISQETGVPVFHETHRGKFSFAAHITRQYLERIEDLRIALDISHWCCVAETLLEDQAEAVALALSRTDHLHARVGFEEGPQIPDPRVDPWQDTLNRHIQWWDQVIDRAVAEERKTFSITSEFGPAPYMQIHPETALPLANQWEINVFMKDLLKKRYRA